jgi:hypothetical protein
MLSSKDCHRRLRAGLLCDVGTGPLFLSISFSVLWFPVGWSRKRLFDQNGVCLVTTAACRVSTMGDPIIKTENMCRPVARASLKTVFNYKWFSLLPTRTQPAAGVTLIVICVIFRIGHVFNKY